MGLGGTYVEIPLYRDLRIELTGGAAPTLRVRPARGAAPAPQPFRPPYGPTEILRALSSIRHVVQSTVQRSLALDTLDPLRDLGTQLFNAVFGAAPFADLYRRELQAAAGQGAFLRLRVAVADPDLSMLPWEFLFDSVRSDFVALSPNSTLVREWTGGPRLPALPPIVAPLQVLVLAFTPDSAPVQPTLALLEQTLAPPPDLLQVRVLRAPDAAAIRTAVAQTPCHLLHLLADPRSLPSTWPGRAPATGRGRAPLAALEGALGALLGGAGRPRVVYGDGVDTDWLARLPYDPPSAPSPSYISFGDTLSARLLGLHPGDLIGDEARLHFTEGLYRGILARQPLEAAVAQGRRAMDSALPGSREWGVPILYLQTPEGLLLGPDLSTVAASPPAAAPAVVLPTLAQYQLRCNILDRNRDALQRLVAQYQPAVPRALQRQLTEVEDNLQQIRAQIAALLVEPTR